MFGLPPNKSYFIFINDIHEGAGKRDDILTHLSTTELVNCSLIYQIKQG